jgi:NADPH:quinone reductase-like Zn-dependent oxidoreductase
MNAVRLHAAGLEGLRLEQIEVPTPAVGEALVRVHAAALTRDELEWPTDRLPATPSYELSGVVAELGPDASEVEVGDEVFALTPFDRDGVAAEYALVPASLLAPKPLTLDHVEAAAVPLAALSAWQGLFDHGRLEAGRRVLIHGASGGVGHLAVQLARARGADVVDADADLIFDTVGGETLARSGSLLREGGRIVSVAEGPPAELADRALYFVVEPNRDQLVELAHLVDGGNLRPAIDSVFPLADARKAFERLEARGKRGKVVLRVAPD